MKILGFETTDAIASVALYIDGEVQQKVLSGNLRHAESVLPAAEQLLRENHLSSKDMDAFAVDVGPGSFTGVRIGVCLANAFAFAHHKKVIAVNSLETLAYPFSKDNRYVAAIIDARNGNAYAALYRGKETILFPAAVGTTDFIEKIPNGSILTGTGSTNAVYPAAESVVLIAAGREGESQVSPLYLKLSQAERMHSI